MEMECAYRLAREIPRDYDELNMGARGESFTTSQKLDTGVPRSCNEGATMHQRHRCPPVSSAESSAETGSWGNPGVLREES